MSVGPDIVVIITDQERAAPAYEPDRVRQWRRQTLAGARWFEDHGVSFIRHYTGSLACVPSRPTLFTGHYPDVHGVTQTDGLGKMADDSRMRWLRPGEVPTLGHWLRAAGYDTHYDGKWHMSQADLHDPVTGGSLATNDDSGASDAAAVRAYLDADPLTPYGFSGWVGPEPHGAAPANCGIVRDPLTAARVVAWLEDRYRRRHAGDVEALRPFLLVASFVNPHDIVFAPAWLVRDSPLEPSPLDPPPVPPAPTQQEDLSSKPAAQIAYRASYPSCYGPAPAVARVYERRAAEYRRMYYRLHAEADTVVDQVRFAVTDGGSHDAVIVRTSDHGELLGAHGGLHQKWFNLYDEAVRVPFVIARTGPHPTRARRVDAPTSHVDLVPTLLAAASIDTEAVEADLRQSFSEVHPLPGRDLMPVVSGDRAPDADRSVYLMTRDNMPEGDSGASAVARRLGRASKPPRPLRIRVPAHVGANFEALVGRVAQSDVAGGFDHLWKIVRTFDDPATWTEPGVRHLSADGPAGPQYRREALPDQWELYDLDTDPVEAHNRWRDPAAEAVFDQLAVRLAAERARGVPTRNLQWTYAPRHASGATMTDKTVRPKHTPMPVARLLRKALQRTGMHPDGDTPTGAVDMAGRRALVVATNHGVLDVGKATGVFASEMTVPYYAFTDAGMTVDVASPAGGVIPVDPMSLRAVIRTEADDRFLGDEHFRAQVTESKAVGDLDMAGYDIVYLAGGWGAAFDLGFSTDLAARMSEAAALDRVIGGVCHGPLGLIGALGGDGRPLVEGRRVTAVTDKQVRELGIDSTPHHPETELRRAGAKFESATRFRDALANHWVVDGNLVTGQNQNAAPMVAQEMMRLVSESSAPVHGA